MAINAQSINRFTINGRRLNCADKFAALVPILHPVNPPSIGASNGGWKVPPQPARWTPPNVPDYAVPTELERIFVTVKFQELSGSDTQEVYPSQDLVTVTDVKIESTIVGVNITDIKIN